MGEDLESVFAGFSANSVFLRLQPDPHPTGLFMKGQGSHKTFLNVCVDAKAKIMKASSIML